MTSMTLPRIASDLLGDVRMYSDEDAFERDERRRPRTDFQLKAVHDHLYQLAIDLKLAARLCVLDWNRPPQFRAALQIEVERASWWPGNANPNNKRDLLSVPLAPSSEAVLGRTWLNIRALAEAAERTTLWHDDPALVFGAAPGVWLGRAACIGHEGLVHYFVYGKRERQWEEALTGAGLRIQAQGEAAYRQHFKEPGQLGG